MYFGFHIHCTKVVKHIGNTLVELCVLHVVDQTGSSSPEHRADAEGWGTRLRL